MRVIAGKYKGRSLKAPDGRGTRPTTDRIKESLFSSIISHFGDLDGACVLDAFAGSGALGIECLSRGASSVVFFEQDKTALRVLKANIGMLGVSEDAARVRNADVLANPPVYGTSFNLVLLDPPYAYEATSILSFLHTLQQKGMLADDALIAYEHSANVDLETLLAGAQAPLRVVSEKNYGKTTAISLLAIE